MPLLDILATVPSLLMTNIAWYIRVGIALVCLIVMFTVAIAAISFHRVREHGHSTPRGLHPEPLPHPSKRDTEISS
jgi:hypothetical protein